MNDEKDKNKSNKNVTCPMSDVREDLAAIAAALRNQSRKKKLDPQKARLLEKGFDIDKEKRKAKYRNASSNRYPTRLQQINDARAEAARQKRLENSDLKAINEETIKVAQERVEQQKKERFMRHERQRYSERPYRRFFITGRPYSEFTNNDYVEVVPSVSQDQPVFKNKIEEAIYRLKNKK